MPIQLYPYQLTFISNILSALSRWKHVIGYARCGFGKSYCIAEIARRSVIKNKKVLILTHRLVLLRQNNGSLKQFGHNLTVINDHGKSMPLDQNLYCSTLQTIQSRMKQPEFLEWLSTYFDLLLIDECHTQDSVFLFESGIFDNTYVIGFTGSPSRDGNQRQLGMDYDEIVSSETVEELIDYGNLVRCRYFEVPNDIYGLEVDPMTGDFTPKSQYQKFDSPEIYGKMIWNYKKYGEGRQFICFCSNIPHAIKTCLEFNKEGIPTKFVVSKLTPPKVADKNNGGEWERYLDRKEAYELYIENSHLFLEQSDVNAEFISGKIQGVITINILSTGWDYKPLSCEIIYRATRSKSLLTQMYGRVQRPFEGKIDAIILDMGTNVARLGIAEAERPASLWHEQSDSVGLAPEKICEGKDKNGRIGCGRSVLASLSICKCGFRFATEKELREVELIERLKEEPNDYKLMSATALRDLAELKGWSKPKLFHILWSRGDSEFRKGMRELGYKNGYIYRMQETYKENEKNTKNKR